MSKHEPRYGWEDDKVLMEILLEVSEETGIRLTEVKYIYNDYCRAVKESMSKFPLMMVKIPYLGTLYVKPKVLPHVMREFLNFFKRSHMTWSRMGYLHQGMYDAIEFWTNHNKKKNEQRKKAAATKKRRKERG
jgi:hypothetical protein